MGVNANTIETYAVGTLREDLQEAFTMISPTETPFLQSARETTASNTLFEWPVVELSAVNATNRVAEGEASPGNDAGTLALRMSNYTQIADKVVEVSHTDEAVTGAANNVQRLSQQVALKLKELKRDMETMLTDNIAATAASSGNARASAGLPAFLRTNVVFVSGGANPTLSGTTEGYPNAAVTAGTTPVVFAEADLNSVIEKCWNEGAEPTIIMCNGGNKRRLSTAFTGNSTRYKDAIDKTLVSAIDYYDSDFGQLTVVPNRFLRTNNAGGANTSYNVYVLDPNYYAVAYLETTKQKPLAETGHSKRTLIWNEHGLQVDNQKAHGVVRDTKNTLT